jgi:hypothetical protein
VFCQIEYFFVIKTGKSVSKTYLKINPPMFIIEKGLDYKIQAFLFYLIGPARLFLLRRASDQLNLKKKYTTAAHSFLTPLA